MKVHCQTPQLTNDYNFHVVKHFKIFGLFPPSIFALFVVNLHIGFDQEVITTQYGVFPTRMLHKYSHVTAQTGLIQIWSFPVKDTNHKVQDTQYRL